MRPAAHLQLRRRQLQHVCKAAAAQARVQVEDQQHRPAGSGSGRLRGGCGRCLAAAQRRRTRRHHARSEVLVAAGAAGLAQLRLAGGAEELEHTALSECKT